ncbi:MAG TPA: hypothetical protein DEQ69_05480 [Rhodobacteraceae bacterium]|nr:hypothetical protein [Paracoccaceae bacterium]
MTQLDQRAFCDQIERAAWAGPGDPIWAGALMRREELARGRDLAGSARSRAFGLRADFSLWRGF